MNLMKSTLSLVLFLLISALIVWGQSTIPIRETTGFPDELLFTASATLPDGRVLAWGGQKHVAAPGGKIWLVNTSYIYDYMTETWTAGPALHAEVVSPLTVELPNGNILSIGGQGYASIAGIDSFPQRTDHVEMYDVGTGEWQVVDIIPFGSSPYTGISAVVLPDSNVWLTSTNGDYGLLDTETLTWFNQTGTLGPLDAGGRPIVILDDSTVFCTGAGGQYYDYPNGAITYLDPPVPMYTSAVRKLQDGRILTWDNGFSFSQEAIMVSADGSSSAVTDSLLIPGQATSGVVMPDSNVWVMGLGEIGFGPFTLLQIFDPTTDTWSSPGTYNFRPTVLAGYKLHLLPDTSILMLTTTSGGKSYRINAGEATALQPQLRLLNWEIHYDHLQAILTLRPGNDRSTADFRLINLQGQTVLTESGLREEKQIALPSLASGVYVVVLEGKNGEWMRRKILVD